MAPKQSKTHTDAFIWFGLLNMLKRADLSSSKETTTTDLLFLAEPSLISLRSSFIHLLIKAIML